MRRSMLALLVALIVPWSAHAQISVQLTMERDTLILFEAVPVVVNVRNFSGRTIELADDNQTSWLSFLISDEASATISPVGKQLAFDPVKIAPGRTVSITVDLLPHYDLRQRGTFTVRAVVDGGSRHALSPPVKFTIIKGREVWKQTVGLPVAAGETNEDYRTYALLSRRAEHNEVLYASVQDDPHELVYGMVPLGETISVGEPSAMIDKAGHLHVLFRSGPRSYSYAEVDPDAKVLNRAVYSDVLSVPHLVTDADGTVVMRGGEQTYPRVERVMTDQELRPPPPPPQEKPPKKKWWWPFGTNKTATNTNAGSATATNRPPDNTWTGG
ncbi:MAG TPA: hypothetical protein VNL17_02405 [Verrucomicrobiae bacterium]|nr:hypothetical protein [Verrucomicrobiae bacterium]